MPRNLGFSDGSSMSIDRTREAGVRTLGFSDGSSIKSDQTPTIQEDEAGNSRPLLSKLLGGAAVAFSLRDLNDKQGESKVVNVRRSADNVEKIFKAKEVPIIHKWVNGEQDTTLPCDLEDNPEDITEFTLSGIESDFNATYTVVGSIGFKPIWRNSSEADIEIQYRGDGKWEIENDGDEYYVSDDIGKDYPWAVTSWSAVSGSSSNTPTFSVGNNEAAAAYSLRKVKKSYNGPLVRLRRPIDNCEVDVYPDSDNKVSEKSRIVNKDTRLSSEAQEKLNTSAKTLGEFIKPVGENLVINNINPIVSTSTSSTHHYNTLTDQRAGGRDCFYFCAQGSTIAHNSTGESYHRFNQHYTSIRSMTPNKKKVAGENLIVKYEYYVPSITPSTPNGLVGVANTCRGLLSQIPYSPQTITPTRTDANNIQLDTWLEGETTIHNGTAANDTIYNGIRLRLAFLYTGDGNVYYDTNRQNDDEINVDGHGCYIRNVRVYSDEVDAKVVTWYNQGTANADATAITHATQPNLVENGALITDANGNATLDFPNTGGQDTHRLETNFVGGNLNSLSVYCVCKSDNTNTLGDASYAQVFTQGSYSSNERFYIAIKKDTANFQLGYGTGFHDLGVPVDTNQRLFSINASTNIESNVNAVKKYPSSGTQASQDQAITRSSSFIGGHTSTDAPWDGTISELIYYNSDQSANRFKIESNINKYYGLYNDVNEWDLATTSAWTSNAASGFTANGTDGFTLTTSGSATQEFKLKIPTDTSGDADYFKVSFNNNDPDGLISSTQLRVTPNGVGGSTTSISNGFNSLDVSNNSGYSFAYFSINADGGGSSKTATLSDFKVSRISRNGFVETWHDQSGNDRHASQTEEQAQPYIVINGGSVKTAKGFYAIDQDGRKAGSGPTQKAGLKTEYNPTGTDGALTEYSVFALYELYDTDNTNINATLFSSGGAAGNAGYGGIILRNTSGSRLMLNNTDGNATGGGSSSSATSTVAATASNATAYGSVYGIHLISGHFKHGVGMITREDGVTSADEEPNAGIPHASNNANQGKVMLLAEFTYQQTNPWKARASEIIFYEKDHRLNTEAIEANINNQYQIYS